MIINHPLQAFYATPPKPGEIFAPSGRDCLPVPASNNRIKEIFPLGENFQKNPLAARIVLIIQIL
jgi:hypothetical protein